jgi:hypothetical protein
MMFYFFKFWRDFTRNLGFVLNILNSELLKVGKIKNRLSYQYGVPINDFLLAILAVI